MYPTLSSESYFKFLAVKYHSHSILEHRHWITLNGSGLVYGGCTVHSEYRLYGFILDSLKDMGWNEKPPYKGGEVYTQNEALRDPVLKSAFGQQRPENVAVIRQEHDKTEYWVIEAKADFRAIGQAIQEAKARAQAINNTEEGACHIVTGVAGDHEALHYVETFVLTAERVWEPLRINDRIATGFIAREQAITVLDSGGATLKDYEIDDDLFVQKTTHINSLLHEGGINKRNRASVLACLLLALAQDPKIQMSDDLATLINDVNSRAARILKRYEKESFYEQIRIQSPTSKENHIKYKKALDAVIVTLRGLNISSAVNSGRDVLGQFYEQFLTYANDAKELGIVFTPRHITSFAARVIDVRLNDIVFDPACGTGGFLVASLDKVKSEGGSVDDFKKGNLYGIEQDQLIVTLAIVNMIFRGDGSSNIAEGNGLTASIPKTPHKVLMNPPFAMEEKEWEFVDRALTLQAHGGLLFAVLPTTCLTSADDKRGEITWRMQMLRQHQLMSVIKLPEDLFLPNVSKGTYGVVIRAKRPHNFVKDKVLWAVLDDGIVRRKTRSTRRSNLESIQDALSNFLISSTVPAYIPHELDCSPIWDISRPLDLSPESHIGRSNSVGEYDIDFLKKSLDAAKLKLDYNEPHPPPRSDTCLPFPLSKFYSNLEKGKSGRKKELPTGLLPLISTSEQDNGISCFVDRASVNRVYQSGNITISSNGASCCAFLHEYEFAANPDVFVLEVATRYASREFKLLLCAAINAEKWRFNYYRKFSKTQLDKLVVLIPVDMSGEIDLEKIEDIVRGTDRVSDRLV